MKDHILGPGTVEWLGVSYRTILQTQATGGAMSITDSVAPEGSSPPRHVHEAEDEAFVVLTGEVEMWVTGETVTLAPGQSAFVPRGREHTFRVLTGPSRMLVILTPGGFDGFWAEMAAGNCRVPEDMAAIEESGRRHNLVFTGPPLGA